MTADVLRECFRLLGVAARGPGEWYCPCAVCQPSETEPDEYRCSVTPGRSRLFVARCWSCCRVGDSVVNREWWSEFCRQSPPMPDGAFAPLTESEVRRCWSLAVADFNEEPPSPAADADVLDAVYTRLLEGLDLGDRHGRWIRRRGLDTDWAFGAGYRTSPGSVAAARPAVADADAGAAVGDGQGDADRGPRPGVSQSVASAVVAGIAAEFGASLDSVPGFSGTAAGRPRLWLRQPAVLMPVRDRRGRAVALRQRLFGGRSGHTRWVSSAFVGGPEAVASCHCPLGVGSRRWPRLWLTEGERKADVVWTKREWPTVSVPGVGAWRLVLPLLPELVEDGGEVVVALDRDEAGRTHTPSLAAAAAALGYRVLTAEWADGKGLDDAVLRLSEPTLTEFAVPPTTPTPTTPHQSRRPQPPLWKWVEDDQIVDFVRRWGPLLRFDIRCRQYEVTKLLERGLLRATNTAKGQLLRVPDAGRGS